MRSDHILDAIDSAIRDHTVSADAMRSVPGCTDVFHYHEHTPCSMAPMDRATQAPTIADRLVADMATWGVAYCSIDPDGRMAYHSPHSDPEHIRQVAEQVRESVYRGPNLAFNYSELNRRVVESDRGPVIRYSLRQPGTEDYT